jgi:ubiquinol-cytochrome c reductase cytochrome c1 subunit
MVRLIAGLVGLFFTGILLWSFGTGAVAYIKEPPAQTAEKAFHLHPEPVDWSFNGPFGKYDHAQLQRGYQVYEQVCSACHSLTHVAFRDLEQIGYSEAEVKAIAKNWGETKTKITDVDPKTGDKTDRDPVPADKFPHVYYAGQGNPVDLSLVVKARHDGSNYVHALIMGYRDQAGFKNAKGEVLLDKFPDLKTPDGLYFNPYFANLNIAMPPPLAEGQVTYDPGQPKPTVDQMSRDVTAFLTWAAEPKMEARKQTGLAVLFFLLIATTLAYMSYRTIWAEKKGH